MLKQALLKYKGLPKQVKASLWFIISSVMLKGISFFTLPIFSRLLTTDEYGVVTVYQSWVSVISIITALTIWGGVFNVGMVKYSSRKYEMMSSFQGMATTITVLFAVLTMLIFPIIHPFLRMNRFLTVCMFLEILAQIPFNLWSTEQRFIYEYRKLIIITVAISLLNPLISYIAIINTPYKAEARILCGLIVHLLFGVPFFILNLIKGKRFFSKFFWKFGFLFNIVLIPHYLSMQILSQSDRIMIERYCGKSDAGIYNIAYTFAMLLSLVTSGINSSLTPHIYQCMKTGNEKVLRKQTTAIIAVVAFFTIGLIAFIPDMFHLLLPESYYSALKVIPPVAASAFFLFLYPLFGAIEFYYEENKYVTYASVIGAVLNIVLNYVFINAFGFIAAAYTTLLCYVCFNICHYYFMVKILKKNSKSNDIYDLKAIVLISLAVIVISIAMVSVYDGVVIRWLIIAAMLAAGIWKRNDLIQLFRSIKNK